ncbi:MAG: AraC family transcriptional regulator [Myxococcota bacterium]
MDGSLPATTAQWTTRQLLARGVELHALLEGTGLDSGWLENGRAEVSFRAYEQLVLNALEATRQPWLGLTLGVEQKLPELGVWGYAVMSSATLDDAAEVAHRFWAVSGSLVRIALTREEDIDTWALHPVSPALEPRVWRFAAEETLAATMTSSGLLSGRPLPYASIELSYPRPSYAERYLEVLGLEVRFDAGRDVFTFPRVYGPMPVVSHSAEIAEACLRHCEARMQALERPDALVHAIQSAIVESSCRLIQLEELADHLGLGPRTLQRRLREESGTTFQRVRDELRARLAKSLLQETSLSVEAVAHRLGFSAASNFRVAFKRWTGMTVQQFRLSTEWPPGSF